MQYNTGKPAVVVNNVLIRHPPSAASLHANKRRMHGAWMIKSYMLNGIQPHSFVYMHWLNLTKLGYRLFALRELPGDHH